VNLPYTIVFQPGSYRMDHNDRHLPEYSKTELLVRSADLTQAIDRCAR
jgi:hypothetical protein